MTASVEPKEWVKHSDASKAKQAKQSKQSKLSR